jgi:hypothetical protein
MAIIPAQEKVFMVSNSTNTTYSGSAALKAMQQWYTMQDVSDSIVAPYKVFTALLTQSGGDDPRNVPTDTNNLIKGITYKIVSVGAGEDMTLYGAPNNDPGTYFICTVDTEVFTSELNYNQGAPVVNVLENTIGNIWWEYQQVGGYLIKSNDLFTQNKTILFASSMNNGNDTNNHTATIYVNAPSELTFASWGNTGDNQQELDNSIPLPIEIRVYN